MTVTRGARRGACILLLAVVLGASLLMASVSLRVAAVLALGSAALLAWRIFYSPRDRWNWAVRFSASLVWAVALMKAVRTEWGVSHVAATVMTGVVYAIVTQLENWWHRKDLERL
jgi:hypothetical protein